MDGLLTEVVVSTHGSAATAAVAIGGTSVPVENLTEFADEGGKVDIAGVVYDYTGVDATTVDPDGIGGAIILPSPGLTVAVAEFDPVLLLVGGEPAVDYFAEVDLIDDEDGEPVLVPLETREERLAWPVRVYDPPLPVTLAPDLSTILRTPGVVPILDGSQVDASTLDVDSLPPIPQTDGNAPTAATTVTPIGGIGSMFYRWTEITNNDPVTYRLHVRAGSAPTTDGTYEVAAGVGLTSAAVRKLKDGTAIVGDGTVTYHAIVTVGDADGPGPASTDVTGIPAQVTTADIAANAITANLLTANDAFIDALDATDITGQTITGGMYRTTASGMRVEVGPGETFTFPSNEVRFYTGSSQETDPARVIALAVNPGTTSEFGQLRLEAPEWTAASGSTTPPIINLNSRTHDGSGASRILMSASEFRVDATAEVAITATAGDIVLTPEIGGEVRLVGGPLLSGATMGSGGVGTGAFRDSVDARVTAVAPTVTMTTGSVGTGTFRDAVDARANAMSAARMQAGTASSGTVVAATTKTVTVTFPTAFSSAPKVTLTSLNSDPGVDRRVAVVPGSETTTTFQVAFWRATGTASFDTNWLAVKP